MNFPIFLIKEIWFLPDFNKTVETDPTFTNQDFFRNRTYTAITIIGINMPINIYWSSRACREEEEKIEYFANHNVHLLVLMFVCSLLRFSVD